MIESGGKNYFKGGMKRCDRERKREVRKIKPARPIEVIEARRSQIL